MRNRAPFELSIQAVLTLRGVRALVQATKGLPEGQPVEVREGTGTFAGQQMLWVERSGEEPLPNG